MMAAPNQKPLAPLGDEALAWYVVHTHSRHEAKVEWGLQARGLEVFLPRMTRRSRRRDRSQFIDVPLFSGYLFVHTDLSPWAYDSIIRHHGVVRILGVNGQCVPVPRETVDSIHKVVTCGGTIECWPRLVKGMRVSITQGPLAGATGVILRKKDGRRRLVVTVDLLGRAVAVDLAEEALEPVV
jgi:transcription termination/antitermination protein NusG